jgi:DNA-binding HxlR family transcriptional regulator
VGRRNRNPRCAVNVAIEVVGDPWSLLVVRDIVFYGKHTFREFLASDERITTSVLADRLASLVEQGILTKHRLPTDRRQARYELTEKGLALIPVLVELGNWGVRYGPDVTPHSAWAREASDNPARLHALVRETVAAGGAAFRGADNVLERLEDSRRS